MGKLISNINSKNTPNVNIKININIKSKTKNIKPKFSELTFKYFDLAKKNKFKKEWFDKNKALYEEHVKAPFSYLVELIDNELGPNLKKINVDPTKITRPIRPSNRAEDQGWIKDHSHITLCEPKTSLFEWNPGIHIQFGTKPDDNLIGLGLYLVSSRQIQKFREAAFKNHELLDKITNERKFKSLWGTSFGEKYKRFPKGYDALHPSAKYVVYKQFFIGQNFSRKEVISSKFIPKAVEDLKSAMPFLDWVREAVGTYKRVPRLE